MHLDLGGIAKGYAVDEALKVLREHGLNRSLVAGGGDMAVGDPPPGEKGWLVRLSAPTPEDLGEHDAALWLSNEAIATSGDLFQFIEIDGTRYSHIVDPRTGVGLTNQSLVTVVSGDGITADSLATTISVLGPERGLKFLRQIANAEAMVSWKADNEIHNEATRGFSERVDWIP
jgi:thiamine biosynthesis lipoprotein